MYDKMLSDRKDSYKKNKKSFSINLGKYKNKFSLLKEINTLTLFCAWID
ncbi:hypothetical protein [Borreliella burgdorferi]|nr:hypothetical protein [Borreliella burgdorferi]